MAKRNNNQDETPILWEIPGFRKGPRAPVPLNQPHWIYKNHSFSKPTIATITFSAIFGFSIFGIVGFLFLQLWNDSQVWYAKPFLILMFGLGIYGLILVILQQIALYKSSRENDDFEKKSTKRKRHPRRRKDYQ